MTLLSGAASLQGLKADQSKRKVCRNVIVAGMMVVWKVVDVPFHEEASHGWFI